jgi:hypothetical protein
MSLEKIKRLESHLARLDRADAEMYHLPPSQAGDTIVVLGEMRVDMMKELTTLQKESGVRTLDELIDLRVSCREYLNHARIASEATVVTAAAAEVSRLEAASLVSRLEMRLYGLSQQIRKMEGTDV